MAGVTGLEPAASGVTGRRSNQLSYTPVVWETLLLLETDHPVKNIKVQVDIFSYFN